MTIIKCPLMKRVSAIPGDPQADEWTAMRLDTVKKTIAAYGGYFPTLRHGCLRNFFCLGRAECIRIEISDKWRPQSHKVTVQWGESYLINDRWGLFPFNVQRWLDRNVFNRPAFQKQFYVRVLIEE